jgi:4-carboxymuconolactone decarboxylase
VTDSGRHERGLRLWEAIQGPQAAADLRRVVDPIAPGFADVVAESVFGGIYTRDGLTLRDRQLLNVAVLAALGGADGHLAAHIRGALEVGASQREIAETLVHVAIYAGFPRAISALTIAADVFDDVGRFEPGSR